MTRRFAVLLALLTFALAVPVAAQQVCVGSSCVDPATRAQVQALGAKLDSLNTFLQDQLGDLWGSWGDLNTRLDSLVRALGGGGPPPPDAQPTLVAVDTFSVTSGNPPRVNQRRIGVRAQLFAHGWDTIYVQTPRADSAVVRGAGDPATLTWAQNRPSRIPGPTQTPAEGCTARAWAGNPDGTRSNPLTFDWCDVVLGMAPAPPGGPHIDALDVLPASFTVDVGQARPMYAIYEMSDGRPYLCTNGQLREALKLDTSYARAAKPDSAAVRPNGATLPGPCGVQWSSSNCAVLTVSYADGTPGECGNSTRAFWRDWYVASR